MSLDSHASLSEAVQNLVEVPRHRELSQRLKAPILRILAIDRRGVGKAK